MFNGLECTWDFLSYLEFFFVLDFASFLKFDCVFGMNYQQTLYIYTFLPVFIMFCAVINYNLLSCQLLRQVKSAQSNFVKLNKLWEESFGILFDLMDDDNTGTLNLKETTELIVGLNFEEEDTK